MNLDIRFAILERRIGRSAQDLEVRVWNGLVQLGKLSGALDVDTQGAHVVPPREELYRPPVSRSPCGRGAHYLGSVGAFLGAAHSFDLPGEARLLDGPEFRVFGVNEELALPVVICGILGQQLFCRYEKKSLQSTALGCG